MTLKLLTGDNTKECRILGPMGMIIIRDLVWVTDRLDIVELYYWEAWAVTQGCYHCCFSIPGKVTLLPID